MPYAKDTHFPVNERPAGSLKEPVTLGTLTVDRVRARVFRDGHEFHLRPKVFRVLRFLIQNPGRLVDFDEMIQEV
jgi:DNA-binding response OmpR family regulator